MTTHGWVTQRDVSTGLRAERYPVTTTSSRHDNRITTILLEDFEHISGSKHSHLRSLRAYPYRLKPWYSSPTSTATGLLVFFASSKATEIRGASALVSTR